MSTRQSVELPKPALREDADSARFNRLAASKLGKAAPDKSIKPAGKVELPPTPTIDPRQAGRRNLAEQSNGGGESRAKARRASENDIENIEMGQLNRNPRGHDQNGMQAENQNHSQGGGQNDNQGGSQDTNQEGNQNNNQGGGQNNNQDGNQNNNDGACCICCDHCDDAFASC